MAQPATSKRRPRPARPWLITFVGWLLVLEAAGAMVLAASPLPRTASPGQISPDSLPQALVSAAFGVLGLVALVTAAGFLRSWRPAWLGAMFLQGAALLLALELYRRDKSPQAYLIMLAGIFMVLYLNHADVLSVFRPRPVSQIQDRSHDR